MSSLLECTLNTRDLGGHPAADGGRTRNGRVWRSDAPANPTRRDVETLMCAGITTIVDLRTPEEAEKTPNPLADLPGFRCVHIPFLEGSAVPPSLKDVPRTYLDIAQSPRMAEVFRAVAGARGGVMIHCSAGKDRTGVISALLLLFCGVPDAEIVSDYALSGKNYRLRLAPFLAAHPETDPRIVLAWEQNMLSFLALFRQAYPDMNRYFRTIGVNQEQMLKIKSKLMDESRAMEA